MKNFQKLAIALSLLIVFCTNGSAFNKAGRTSLQFLKIGIGARPVSMGEACIANISTVNAVFWNPALITGFEGGQVAFDYTQWIGDLDIISGAIAYNFDHVGAFAVYFLGLDYGDIAEALTTSPTGKLDTRTGNSFSGGDLAIGFNFARKFTDQLAVGIAVKYVREELFEYSTSLFAFDVGSYYDTGWNGIKLAMTAQNFAKQARFLETRQEYEQSYELPLIFRIGWSIDLLGGENLLLGGNPEESKFTFNMDAVHSNDYAERLYTGAEYWFLGMFALRAGYRFNQDEGNLSAGAGINYQVGSMDIRIDYAYVDYNFLKATHRFTVILGL